MRRLTALLLIGFASQIKAQGPPVRADSAAAIVETNRVYFEFQVETPVRRARDSAKPRYPRELRTIGAEGQVQVEFVVDTLGFADTASFKVLKTTHELFAAAVREVLPKIRFLPAELKGRKVKQMVRQRFVFPSPD